MLRSLSSVRIEDDGLGGFTEGAIQAGVRVLWAGNHWPEAVRAHAANHPDVEHLTQDLRQADWRVAPAHDLLTASPSCVGNTPARGKEKPHHDTARSTAWAVVDCAEYHRPRAILVENVPGFLDWILYPAWKLALEALGYSVSPHLVEAADCGVPQERLRVIVACTRSKAPLQLKLPKYRHVPALEIIDFEQGSWTPVRKPGRAPATLRRAINGRRQFGDRFVMPYYGSGSGLTGRTLDRPIGTITTVDRWAVVRGSEMRILSISEYKRAMSFPEGYRMPGTSKRLDIHLLGNAIPPLMAKECILALQRAW